MKRTVLVLWACLLLIATAFGGIACMKSPVSGSWVYTDKGNTVRYMFKGTNYRIESLEILCGATVFVPEEEGSFTISADTITLTVKRTRNQETRLTGKYYLEDVSAPYPEKAIRFEVTTDDKLILFQNGEKIIFARQGK